MTAPKRIAIVTGASRQAGLGAAICKRLAEDGVDVFFTYWTAYDRSMPWSVDTAEQDLLLQQLEQSGVRAAHLEVDLSQPQAASDVFDACERLLGPATILVNNACFSGGGGYEQMTAASLDEHYAINVRAVALLSAEFARRYTAGSGGRIINIATGQALGAMYGEVEYAITKAAIESLTRTLAPAVGRRGITINAVNPGPTDTGWMDEALQRDLQPRFPLGRIGQPDDAARLVRFLASPDAEWVTGQVIHSEGGFER